MARDFSGGNFYVELGEAVLAGEPLTIACWFRPNNVANNETLVGLFHSANARAFELTAQGGAAGDPVRCRSITSTGTTQAASTTTGYVSGRWQHACGVLAAANDRRVFLDGAGKGANTTNQATGAFDRTRLGAGSDATGALVRYFDGALAEVGFWTIALTDAEVAYLATPGVRPIDVRPGALVAYYPLDHRDAHNVIYNRSRRTL